jgi:hypothetical protein
LLPSPISTVPVTIMFKTWQVNCLVLKKATNN